MSAFAAGEQPWVERLGNLRNTVRQDLIARQLAGHIQAGTSVLDVGCGQGTQAVRLAERGCSVTGVDPSPDLLTRLTSAADAAGVHVEALPGGVADLPRLLGNRTFDAVCAHGLLMYLDDLEESLGALARHVAADGLLSITFRNGDALAFRPGMRRHWRAALDAFDSDSYVNELGVLARAHRLAGVTAAVERLGFRVAAWYGVRVFTDTAAPDEPPPGGDDLDALLDAEWLAGQRDPYRRFGSQLHVVAARASR